MEHNISESNQSPKLRNALLILVPFVYGAVMLQSVTGELFLADDPGEMDFVRIRTLPQLLFGYDAFGLFRPVKNLLWIVFSRLAPIGIDWCHVVAIAIGILSFFSLLALCRRIFKDDWKALAASSVWILSPTLVSSAAWLSCVNIQLMAVFAALTIIFHDMAWDGDRFRASRIAFAGLFLFLALVSYECAVAVAPILLAFDCLLRSQRLRDRKAWFVHGIYWSIVFLFLVLRHFSGSVGTTGGRWIEATRGQLIVSSPWFAMQHVASWFWPFGRFSVGGSYVWGEVSGAILVGCATIGIVILGFALMARKNRPALSFGIFFSLFGLAPVCNCLGLGNGPYGDYYLTLASIGLAVGIIEGSWWLMEAKGPWRIPSVFIVIAFAIIRVAAVPEAARWAHLWTRYDLAYAEAAKNFPDSLQNKSGAIQDYVNEGRWEEALEIGNQIENTVGSDSPKMTGIYLVRAAYATNVEKDANKAFSFLDRAESVNAGNVSENYLHLLRGLVYDDVLNDENLAEREFEAALGEPWDCDAARCANRLARRLAIRGETSRAVELWERAAKVNPNDVTVLWNLFNAYHDAGDVERAAPFLQRVRALTGNPDLGKESESSNGK